MPAACRVDRCTGGGLEISEGRFGAVEENLHQSACSIVDKYQCRAFGTAVFEPMMFAAIDLNELTDAPPASTWAVEFSVA